MLSPREVEEALADAEVVPVAQAGIGEAKEIVEACLAAGVPAVLGRDDHCKKGCSPKLLVLAREADVPRIAQVMQARWAQLAIKDGVLERVAGRGVGGGPDDPDAEPPCPACGSTGALVDGACPECGLQLG